MMKSNFSMIENDGHIPFAKEYSLLASSSFPEWFLKFKRQGFESYLKNYETINPFILNFISGDDFKHPLCDVAPSFDIMLKYPMLDVEAYTIVIVNGRYSSELSSEEELPFSIFSDGILCSLNDDADFLDDKLRCDDNALVALNSAYLSNGIVVDVADNTKLEKPIHIISIVCSDTQKLFVNPRIVVKVGKNSFVDIIESNFSLDEKYFENKVCQFDIGENSFVNHYRYYNVSQNSCMAENNFFNISDYAKFNQAVFIKQMGIFRSFYQFDAEKETKFDSILSVDAKNKENSDISFLIKHNKDDAVSNVSLFATVNDEADVNFMTSVQCANGTSGVDTAQISRILLNSPNAKGRIKPLQDIWSEKVKAYHGAVISGVDKKDLFFLESRGIDTESAKILVLKSCLANILQNIHNEKISDAFYNLIWL